MKEHCIPFQYQSLHINCNYSILLRSLGTVVVLCLFVVQLCHNNNNNNNNHDDWTIIVEGAAFVSRTTVSKQRIVPYVTITNPIIDNKFHVNNVFSPRNTFHNYHVQMIDASSSSSSSNLKNSRDSSSSSSSSSDPNVLDRNVTDEIDEPKNTLPDNVLTELNDMLLKVDVNQPYLNSTLRGEYENNHNNNVSDLSIIYNDDNDNELVDVDVDVDVDDDYEVLAKKIEPGDRDAIIQSIKKVQRELIQPDPIFPYDTILSRTLDTIEDIVVHARRVPYDYGWVNDDEEHIISQKKMTKRDTIVVLGSGWAAHALLKVVDTFAKRIIVVSPSNHFVFTPMLASAAVGTVEYRSMTEAVRAANPMIDNYIEGSATTINVTDKTITVQLKQTDPRTTASSDDDDDDNDNNALTIQYDKLVVAVGCKVADNLVPGAKEYSLRLKSCDDARRLREAVGVAFEYASRPDVRPIISNNEVEQYKNTYSMVSDEAIKRQKERQRRVTFCIVGGGPTGVELAGELADFVKDICKPRVGAYPMLINDVQIILLHGGPELVPQFDKSLSQSAYDALREKSGVDVRLNTSVKEVGDGYVRIASKGTGVEEVIPCGVCVWAAGTEMVPFIDTLLEQLPSTARGVGGKVVVDKWLRCPMYDTNLFGSILVVGDAAAFVDRDHTSNSNGQQHYLPQTAQVAAQQGAYVARLIDRDFDLSVTPPSLVSREDETQLDEAARLLNIWLKLRGLEQADGFQFLNLGLLAYIGSGQALSQVQIGDIPLGKYAGSTAFILWRSVYLVKQVATRNRILVTFDWIKSAIFGRDITRL